MRAVSTFLARELPQALIANDLRHLEPYFAEDVELRSNIPNSEPLKGKKWILMLLGGKRKFGKPTINGVIAGGRSIAIVQNILSEQTVERVPLAPRIDIFHLNSAGKVFLVESTVSDNGSIVWGGQ